MKWWEYMVWAMLLVGSGVLLLMALYVVSRVISAGVFRSWWEVKKQLDKEVGDEEKTEKTSETLGG